MSTTAVDTCRASAARRGDVGRAAFDHLVTALTTWVGEARSTPARRPARGAVDDLIWLGGDKLRKMIPDAAARYVWEEIHFSAIVDDGGLDPEWSLPMEVEVTRDDGTTENVDVFYPSVVPEFIAHVARCAAESKHKELEEKRESQGTRRGR